MEGLIEIENPNRVSQKSKKVTELDLSAPRELSRRERCVSHSHSGRKCSCLCYFLFFNLFNVTRKSLSETKILFYERVLAKTGSRTVTVTNNS